MRKYLLITLIIVLLLILTSCSLPGDNLNINFKNDKLSNIGYAAVVYEDRIYYVSNELGTSGIYSMHFDGSDIRMETANPDITGIEIRDKTLYYGGLIRINKKLATIQSSTIQDHTIYKCALGEKAHLISQVPQNYNLKKFFISQDGYKFMCHGSDIMETLNLLDTTFSQSFSNVNDKVATVSFQYTNKSGYGIESDEGSNTVNVLKNIYQYGDLCIIAAHIPEDYESDMFTFTEDPYVLDSNTGELVIAYDQKQADALKAFYMDESSIYCSYKEMIIIIDRLTYQIKTAFIPEGLSEEYNITYMTKCGSDIYIIADNWRDQNRKLRPLKGEIFYIMDSGTFDCKEVLNIGSDKRIIGIDEDYIILLDDTVIYKLEINNGSIGEKTKIVDAPSAFDKEYYTIDYAADWMFIYKTIYSEQDDTNINLYGEQLIYKINLQSGEVIQNDMPFDFSAFDRYKEP
jgi:hypothetical protein